MNSRASTGSWPVRSNARRASACACAPITRAIRSWRLPSDVEKPRSPRPRIPGTRASWNGARTPLGEKPSSSMRRSSSYCFAIHESMNSRSRALMRSCVAASITYQLLHWALPPLCSAAEQNVLEKLARSPPCSSIDVSGDSFFKKEARVLENCGVKTLRIIHDDEHPSIARELRSGVVKHLAHCVNIGVQRSPAPSDRCCSNLFIASVDQAKQLVGVAMLLVVVDQARVGRGRYDPCRRCRQT